MRGRASDFKRKVLASDARPVGLARITYADDGQTVVCSCGGWVYTHPRAKVRENAIDRHLARQHGERGIRL